MITKISSKNFIYPIPGFENKSFLLKSLKSLEKDTVSFKGTFERSINQNVKFLAAEIFDKYEEALDNAESFYARYQRVIAPNFNNIKKIFEKMDVVTTSLVLNELVRMNDDHYGDTEEKIQLAEMLRAISAVKSYNKEYFDSLKPNELVQQLRKSSEDLLKQKSILSTAINLFKSALLELTFPIPIPNDLKILENQINDNDSSLEQFSIPNNDTNIEHYSLMKKNNDTSLEMIGQLRNEISKHFKLI